MERAETVGASVSVGVLHTGISEGFEFDLPIVQSRKPAIKVG